ncbi:MULTISPECIES: NAD(P)/FAD-dependent oxidoreductase [Microbacterium]|uniref:Reductase C-terminal n=1 Tax=Microbacterium saccharophilum TaxID=1213358 RepID=A0A7Z7GF15_9MICO|nr:MULTISPECIES: FAD-dependent oxidoreductase [Microbacterium]SFI78186.1 Reductase C-terminal [Microbacterium saccharophilum]
MNVARDPGRVVVVGGGLAGFSAADQLRTLGHQGEITIVDAEPHAYDRPPLSKNLFDEDFSLASLAFATKEGLVAKRIDTVFGVRATAIDADAASVTLADGRVLAADTVLLSVGGSPRTLSVPGNDLPGVYTLRTFDDALAIRERAQPGARAVVIGAGLIGAELASALQRAGVAVTLLGPAPVPLLPVLGELLATHLHSMHVAHGVRAEVGVAASITAAGDALIVTTVSGEDIPADVVVVGVGIVPNTSLAEAAGLAVDNGVLVDRHHQTSAPKVFAAGDLARLVDDDGVAHRREEHWEAAQLSGQHAAYGMLGLEAPARGASWFWSDRHGIHLEATGRLSGEGELIVRQGGAHPAVFLVHDGLLVGAAAIDDNNTVRAARRLIDRRIPVSPTELADPAIVLKSLLRASR